MLDEDQWAWLEGDLRKPANLRLIASGTRVLAEKTVKEEWASFPGDPRRVLGLIGKTAANGVMFVNSNPHFSEYSKVEDAKVPYPL
jgi:alkaline phosphatase D